MDWANILKIVIVILVVIEGIFVYLRLKQEMLKKSSEKSSQVLIANWHGDLNVTFSELLSIGDLILTDAGKDIVLNKLKQTIENQRSLIYSMLLFSASDPVSIMRALNYFKDREREDVINGSILRLLKARISVYKDPGYKIVRNEIENMLVRLKSAG